MSCRVLACALLVGCAASKEDGETEHEAIVAASPYTLEISTRAAVDVDEPFIRREVEAAIALYRRDVAVPAEPVAVVVDAPDCLRTGYDMPSRRVLFCNNDDTPRAGTASADVIHHEVFHALFCQSKPDWCDASAPANIDRSAWHEGLADYFAYVLAPDAEFGEGFYRDQAFVRRYRVPYCYSLVSGGHEKGNAIVDALIERGHGLDDVKRLVAGREIALEDECFGADPPHVVRTVTGYPESTLERYRVRADAPLELRFAGDPAFERRYPNLTIRWEPAPTRFAITADDPRSFHVTVTGTSGFEKIAALYVVDGAVVGGKSFYFQVARP
ncbi:MAG: hypothetical protein U0270_01320 [Labilithrix sp.]